MIRNWSFELMLARVLVLFLMVGIILFPPNVVAAENQFVTVVNPVRISRYTPDLIAGLEAQSNQLKQRQLPATWLLTAQAMTKPEVIEFAKSLPSDDEVGVFLEITQDLADRAGVTFRIADSWHRANSLFVTGYTQAERVKLVDQVMGEYYQHFNEYPKSVGAWWIDSFSLEYLQQKYGVIAALGCADQFATDGYGLWGQPWMSPYYPHRLHAGLPAHDSGSKIDLVKIQWAPRDPLLGYGDNKASLYSTQDYFTINLDERYFEKLIKLYGFKGLNQYGQVTVGLEGDLGVDSYNGIYAKQLSVVKQLVDQGQLQPVTMAQFSQWFRSYFPETTPPMAYVSSGLLGDSSTTVWYTSPKYRFSGVSQKDKFVVRDWRNYQPAVSEPYRLALNRRQDLEIFTPWLIDGVTDSTSVWQIPTEQPIRIEGNSQKLEIDLGSQGFELKPNQIKLINLDTPEVVKRYLDPIDGEGLVLNRWRPEVTNLLQTKRGLLISVVVVSAVVGLGIWIVWRRRQVLWLIGYGLVVIGFLWGFQSWSTKSYLVSAGEVSALLNLRTRSEGRVLVPDRKCLQCRWEGPYQPLVFINDRDYVEDISQQTVIKDDSLFNTNSREEGRKILKQLDIDYIYLVRIEDYSEETPFSPGDLGLTRIYQNGNAYIWKVDKEKL